MSEYQKVGTTWNPTADPNAKFPDDVYVIDRMAEEVPGQITYELAPAWDHTGSHRGSPALGWPMPKTLQNSHSF